jgi:hypothetical protein
MGGDGPGQAVEGIGGGGLDDVVCSLALKESLGKEAG